MSRVAVLLGSGLSRAARVPNVMELTTCLMKDAVSVGTMTSDPAPDGADSLFTVLREIMDSHLRTINLCRAPGFPGHLKGVNL